MFLWRLLYVELVRFLLAFVLYPSRIIQLMFSIILCIKYIMELAWIEDFLALCRTRNFTEAAEQRCTTQSAFSRRVQQLEEWLGAMLFDRGSRPIKLTANGEDFLRRAEKIREDILDARRIAKSSQSHYDKTTRLYTTTAIAVGIVPGWLKKSGVLNHSILTSSTHGCWEALHQKRADQILLPWFANDTMNQQLNYKKITTDNLVLVESFHTKQPVAYENGKIVGPLIMYTPSTIFGQQITTHLSTLKVATEQTVVCESSSAETLLALTKQDLGAAWIPQSLTDASVQRCRVPQKINVSCEIMLIARADHPLVP